MRNGIEQCPNGCDYEALKITTDFNPSDGLPLFNIECGECDCAPHMIAFDKEDAIECWNEAVNQTSPTGNKETNKNG